MSRTFVTFKYLRGFFFFWLYAWHAVVPGPGIEREPRQ